MPSVKDQSTAEAIAREYTSNGRDKAQAMRTIGYAESSCKSGKAVGDVYGNLRVKAAIKAIDGKNEEKAGFTRADQRQRLVNSYAMAERQGNPNAMTGAARALNTMLGYDQEPAVNQDTARAIAQRMSDEDKKLATLAARLRTEAEARKGLKLA